MKINKTLLLSSILISLISIPLSVCFATTFVSSATVAMSGSVQLTAISDIIDNFDSMTGVNNWGGQYAQINTGSGRTVGISYDSTVYAGASGASLKVVYNVPNSMDWAGVSIGLANQPIANTSRNINIYNTFSFDVKGANAGQSFKIEFKENGVTNSAVVYLSDYLDQTSGSNSGTSTGWQTVNIPIDAFANFSSNITNLSEINFIFEHDYLVASGMNTSDTIWLDNIRFSAPAQTAVRIDSFGDGWGLDALGGNIGTMGYTGTSIGYNSSIFSDATRCLQLNYNIPNYEYSGVWFIVGGGSDKNTPVSHDFSAYNKFKIRIKLASATNYPSKIKLELIDAGGTREAWIPDNTVEGSALSTSWQEYTILLNGGDLQRDSIKQFNVVAQAYKDGVGWLRNGADSGTVYFDSIRLEK